MATRAYLSAIGGAFGSTGIDYAQLVKLYGADPTKARRIANSPPVCIGAEATRVYGDPDPITSQPVTSSVKNLTMRMNMRRFSA